MNAEQRLARIIEKHQPQIGAGGPRGLFEWCQECEQRWPCWTVKIAAGVPEKGEPDPR